MKPKSMVREVASIRKESRDAALEDVLDTLSKARSRQAAKAAKDAAANSETEDKDDEAAA